MTTEKQQLDALTSLRFVAALSVFVSHVFDRFPQFGMSAGSWGFAGVGFFFVLSGFILTYVYASRQPINAREFYVRRIARVWPLHLATTLIVLMAMFCMGKQFGTLPNWRTLLANIFLVHTWIPDHQWVFSCNGPAWSLSVEAFFYLLFPLLLYCGVKRLVQSFAIFCVLTFVTLWALDRNTPEQISQATATLLIHTYPIFRLYDFVIGMICGFMFLKYRCQTPSRANSKLPCIQFLSLALCVGYFVVYKSFGDATKDFYSVFLVWLHIMGATPFFALTIFAFAFYRGLLSDLLASRGLVYLGEISFAFYLIHQPILRVVDKLSLAEASGSIYWILVGALLLSLAASIVLHQTIELPARKHLLAEWRGKGPLAKFREYVADATKWLVCGPAGLYAVVLCIVGIMSVNQGKFDHFDQASIQHVTDHSATEFQSVQFDQDAVLLGLTTAAEKDGGYRIRMVWQLKLGRNRMRFIHICDESGKVMRQSNANQGLFKQVQGSETVIESALLSAEELSGAASVMVGFYNPVTKIAPIFENGKATKRLRLTVLSL